MSTAETVTVSNAASTTTTVTASPNPATIGNTVTLTATVKSASGTPAGSVQFVSEGAVLGSSTLSGGVAKLSASSAGLPAGNYGVTAKYLGNTSYAASQGAVTVTLKQ